jgi:hypothetical protein
MLHGGANSRLRSKELGSRSSSLPHRIEE